MARIQCPHCGAPVATAHINMQKLLAACPQCDQVFSIEPFFNAEQLPTPHEKTKRPADLNIETSQDQFQASYLWRKSSGGVIGLAAVIGILESFVGLVLIGGMFLAGIPILLMGLYLLLTVLLNRTTLTITHDRITVRTEPIYGRFLYRSISRSQVAQVKLVDAGWSRDPQCSIDAVDWDGTRRQLVRGLQRNYAQYLVQQITRYLEADQVTAIE